MQGVIGHKSIVIAGLALCAFSPMAAQEAVNDAPVQESAADAGARPSDRNELTDEERALIAEWEAEAIVEAEIARAEAAEATSRLDQAKQENARGYAELARLGARLEAERAETVAVKTELETAKAENNAVAKIAQGLDVDTPEN